MKTDIPKEKIQELLKRAMEMNAQTFDLLREVDNLLNGGVGIGQQLKAIRDAFALAWPQRYTGQIYGWTDGAKETQQLKKLLKTIPVEEVVARVDRFIRNDDPWFVRNRHPFGIFLSSINQHASAGQSVGDLELDDDMEETRRRQERMRG